ncbi:MAG TPA: hypothetical protein EYP53_01760 [Candidatus Latescibacteria bacterium]|nr:hypothetical protein [Candidatus Latescibacterota bacterium]
MIELVPPTYGETSLDENLSILVENGIRIVHIAGDHLPSLGESEISRIARLIVGMEFGYMPATVQGGLGLLGREGEKGGFGEALKRCCISSPLWEGRL